MSWCPHPRSKSTPEGNLENDTSGCVEIGGGGVGGVGGGSASASEVWPFEWHMAVGNCQREKGQDRDVYQRNMGQLDCSQ